MAEFLSLKELDLILSRKYFFTKERFCNYFNTFCLENKAIEDYWNLWDRFPHYNEADIENVAFILEKILEYPNLEKNYDTDSFRIFYKSIKIRKKIFYKNNKGITSFEVNLNETDEIIFYADFLKHNIEKIIVAVDLIEEIYHKSKTIYIYDGDVFAIKDSWKKKKDGKLFACTQDGYRQLLYTGGKGYLRNNEPDYDDPHYNSHVITGTDGFKYIGNLYADPSFLIEESEEKTKGNSI